MAHVSSPWRSVATVAMASVFLVLAGDSETATGIPGAVPSQVPAERDTAAANRLLQGAPSPFVPNLGQWEHPAQFVHRSGGMTMFLEDRGWTLSLVEPRAERKKAGRDRLDPRRAMREPEHHGVRGAAIRMTFEGGDRTPHLVGESKLPGMHNYFLGNDESRWRTHVPLYASVLYRQLYPGIDVRVRQAGGHPEYDLLLQPAAQLGRVAVKVEGADVLQIGPDGSLVMETPLGPVIQPAPRTWESDPSGEKRHIPCRYVMLGPDRFGFEAAEWTRDMPITIDPGLLWSTYLGGSNDDYGGCFVDARGLVTVIGMTTSSEFPTTPGAFDTTHNCCGDAFITQLDPRKTGREQLVYSTFLGGSGFDVCTGLSVNTNGVLTVFGTTSSRTFPTTPTAFNRTASGADDIFVTRMDPNQVGTAQLQYSTFLGGSGLEHISRASFSEIGVLTFVGFSASWDFPTTPGAFATTLNGINDTIVCRLDPNKVGRQQLVYSSFFGGRGGDLGHGLVEASGVITITGMTFSPDLPTTSGAFDRTFNGGWSDAFISTLDPNKTGSAQLLYSTYLGGSGANGDEALHLSVDVTGVLTISGRSSSVGFPTTPGAYDRTYNGGITDGFVSRLDPSKTENEQLLYSTFLGGRWDDLASSLMVDTAGVVTVSGFTGSPDFPVTPGAFDTTYGGGRDAFVARLDLSRHGIGQLLYSTFLGGGDEDVGNLSLDATGVVTIAGATKSVDFPTTPGAYDRTFNGTLPFPSRDAFISCLELLPAGVSAYGSSSPGCTGPLAMSVSSWPQAGNSAFSVTCNNAPPSSLGALLLGASALTSPFPFVGVDLWVDPAGLFFLALPTASNQVGAGDFVLPLPVRAAGGQLAAQFVWFGPSSPAPCPPGAFSASNALDITIQP